MFHNHIAQLAMLMFYLYIIIIIIIIIIIKNDVFSSSYTFLSV